MTPEEHEQARRRALWEAHIAKLEANGGKKPKRQKMTSEEAKERQREQTRRWKAEHPERVREYSREYYAKKAAAMTPEQREARNAKAREKYHALMQDPAYRAMRSARQRDRRAKKKEAASE